MATILAAVLFTDIVGSSDVAAEMGDRRWKELVARHHAIVRRELRRFHGREIDTAGDGFFATFARPAEAIRSAVAISDAVRELGIELRAGVHVGEYEVAGKKIGGLGVHVAARVMGQASAGEVLISGTTRDLVAGSGFQTEERGEHELKGIPGRWRLYEVAGMDGRPRDSPVPADEARARRAAIQPTLAGSRRRPLAVAAAAGAVVVGALLILYAAGVFPGSSGAASFDAGTVLLGLDTGKKITTIPRSQLAAPGDSVFAAGHFWIDNLTPAVFVEVDRKGQVTTQFDRPQTSAAAQSYQPFAVAGTALWVGSGDDLVRIDTSLGQQVQRIPLDQTVKGPGGLVEGVALGNGLVWVSRDVGLGQVVGVDPSTGTARYRFDDVVQHADLAYGDGKVWAADFGGMTVLDPATGAAMPVSSVKSTSRFVVSGGGFGWTSDPAKGAVYKVDQTGRLVATYRTGLGAGPISVSDGTLWVANQDDGTVTGIDAITGQTTMYRFGHPVGVATAADGVLLTYLEPGETVDARFAALGGNVVKLFSQQGELGQDGEPALNWNPAAFQIEYATCAKLLNYPDASGAAAAKLRPEVAAAMPAVSNGGLTYTFTIRPGFEFSPPVNQPLTAEVFRFSIERALSPKFPGFTPAPYFVDDIRGETDYVSGTASHISGLRAHGDKLSITLTSPSPHFLARLALPFFCPVPLGTRAVPGALIRHEQAATGGSSIPSAGPYYVADWNNNKYVILKRNPNYHGSRPHALDAIALREGVDASVAVDDVQHGGWDGIVSSGHRDATSPPEDPLLDPNGPVASRFARGQAGVRYYPAAVPSTGFLVLDTQQGPFADAAARRAVALAVDRTALAGIWAEVRTDQLLPSAAPGFHARRLSSPHPATARALLRGRRPAVTMGFFAACDPCAEEASTVRAELRRVGIRVRLKRMTSQQDAFSVDFFDSGGEMDYADSGGFVEHIVDTLPFGWIPAGAQNDVGRLARSSGPRRGAAAVRAADALVASDTLIPYGARVQGELFTSRVGCRVFPPFGFGVDLAALC